MANELTLREYLDSPKVDEGLKNLLGAKAQSIRAAMLDLYNNNRLLQTCTPRSIVGAVVCAAVNNLSISPSLGQAYLVPYKGQAQFQIGFKGLIQLAHRSRQYVRLHAGKICEGELAGFNPFTGEPLMGQRLSDKVVGYIAYFKLVNGCEKYLYMTTEELEAHAQEYSQSYSHDKRTGKRTSPWTTHFEAMASKTVLKLLLNKWGILSTEMATAIQADQSVIDKRTFTYVDNGGTVQGREGIYNMDLDEPIDVSDLEEVTGDDAAALQDE